MKIFFYIFNFLHVYQNRSNANPLSRLLGFFFIIFGFPLIGAVMRLIYKVSFNFDWGVPFPQSKEILMFDIALVLEFLVALLLVLKLKGQFIEFYLKFYPSIKVSSLFFNFLIFYVVFFYETLTEFSIPYVNFISVTLTFLLYLWLFSISLRQLNKQKT
jgi:hypothetical protein